MKISFVICDPLDGIKKFGSWLIKVLDGSSGSHFAIRKESITGVHYYESVFPKSRKLPEDEWLKHYKIIKQFDFEVPAYLQADVIIWLESMLDKWYAIPQLFLIFFSIILKPLRMTISKVILNHEKALICSEYGSRFVEKFMDWKLYKSHDDIGVKDMEIMSAQLVKFISPWKDLK